LNEARPDNHCKIANFDGGKIEINLKVTKEGIELTYSLGANI
jgi:hypothetical protein